MKVFDTDGKLLVSYPIDDSPIDGSTEIAISSNWAYDHVAAADPHTGYRLESADHTHQSTGAQAGQLDHGLALTGLSDDDHPQYIKHSLATAINDMLMASGAGAFIKKTLAEVKTALAIAADIATHAALTATHGVAGTIAGLADIVTHAALTTGVHGVGAGTVAKTADITATKLDDFAAPDDNTDLNVSITKHGLCPKAPNLTTQYLRGDASWATVTTTDRASKSTANKAIYVDMEAVGGGTGVDWTNAFTTIQAAVNSVDDVVLHAYTISVRAGDKKPTSGTETAAVGTNATTIVSTTASFFVAGDVGKRVVVLTAASAYRGITRISVFTNGTTVTVDNLAGLTNGDKFVVQPTPYRETVYLNSLPATNNTHTITGSLQISGEYYEYGDCENNAVAGKIVDTGAFANASIGDPVWVLDLNGASGAGNNAVMGYVIGMGANYIQTSLAVTPTTSWKYCVVRTEVSGSDTGADAGTARNHCFLLQSINNVAIYGFNVTFSDNYAIYPIGCQYFSLKYCIIENCDYGVGWYANTFDMADALGVAVEYNWIDGSGSYWAVSVGSFAYYNSRWCAYKSNASYACVYLYYMSFAFVNLSYFVSGLTAFQLAFLSSGFVQLSTIPNTFTTGILAAGNSYCYDTSVNNAVTPESPAATTDSPFID